MIQVTLQIVALLIILDAYLYFLHRAMHRYEILWAFHKEHHANYKANFHVYEFALLWLVPMLVAWLCGYMLSMFVIAFVFIFEVGLTHRSAYKKANPVHRAIFRSLKGFLGTAKFHRYHHDYPTTNYTQMFTFWDMVCKTKYKGSA